MKITNEEVKNKVKYIISQGFKGIETFRSEGKEERAIYKELATEFNLLTICRTDYHRLEVSPVSSKEQV